jgi:hypothetical protein
MIRDYRGKRVDNGEWVYGQVFYPHNELQRHEVFIVGKTGLDSVSVDGVHKAFSSTVQPDSLGQWTGYYDRLGELQGKKKWYNGEILGGFHVPLVVLWHNSAFRCYEDLLAQKYVFDLPSTIDCYSIGNVTDDPKLLEAKNE